MDKETLHTALDRDTIRLILLAVGAFIVISVYLWTRWGKAFRDYLNRPVGFKELGLEPPTHPTEQPDEDLLEGIVYSGRKEPTLSDSIYEDDYDEFHDEEAENSSTEETKSSHEVPPVVQIAVIANRGRIFQGEDLKDAFLDLDLIHGDKGIYHRYDQNYQNPLFSIASLVEPGTFPIDEMESFEAPGIILFFQPEMVSEPLSVFEDMLSTSHELAKRLDGIEWDEKRKPLTQEKASKIRALLR